MEDMNMKQYRVDYRGAINGQVHSVIVNAINGPAASSGAKKMIEDEGFAFAVVVACTKISDKPGGIFPTARAVKGRQDEQNMEVL
jgi:hypothetical protein